MEEKEKQSLVLYGKTITEKRCRGCFLIKPLNEYGKQRNPRTANAVKSTCISCLEKRHDITEKRCSVCCEIKAINNFHRHRKGCNQRQAQCRECQNIYLTEWHKWNNYAKTRNKKPEWKKEIAKRLKRKQQELKKGIGKPLAKMSLKELEEKKNKILAVSIFPNTETREIDKYITNKLNK